MGTNVSFITSSDTENFHTAADVAVVKQIQDKSNSMSAFDLLLFSTPIFLCISPIIIVVLICMCVQSYKKNRNNVERFSISSSEGKKGSKPKNDTSTNQKKNDKSSSKSGDDKDSHKVTFLSDEEGSSVSSEGSKKERSGTSKKLTDFYTSIVEDIECDDEEKRRSAIAASYNITKPKSKKDEEERKRSSTDTIRSNIDRKVA